MVNSAFSWRRTDLCFVLAVMVPLACSSAGGLQSSNGGTGGGVPTAGTSGTAGTIGGAGTTGTAGTIGGAGSSGAAGTIGAAGTGGAAALPTCDGVCFVSDADTLPIPAAPLDDGTSTMGIATIEGVGVGGAPAQCESARLFGGTGSSTWWFQARAADGHLWTVGVHGLNATPLVQTGDQVIFNLSYRGYQISGFGPPLGQLQLLDAGGAPLLWAYVSNSTPLPGGSPPGPSWVTIVRAAPVCNFPPSSCDATRYGDNVTVSAAQMVTLAPGGSADLGGFHVAIGQDVKARCSGSIDYFGEAFYAAAAKLP